MVFLKNSLCACAVILVNWIDNVYTQVLNISLVTKEPFKCDGQLRLRCTSSTVGCCTGSTLWNADAASLTLGTKDSKYYEEKFSGYFDLVINKFELADLDKDYSCVYIFDTSSTYRPTGEVHCEKCGGWGVLWVFIGVIVADVVCALFVKIKGVKWAVTKLLVTVAVSDIISLVVAVPIAVPVCIFESLCIASPRLDYLFILLGLIEVPIFYGFGVAYDRCCPGSSASNSASGTGTGTGLSCFPGSKICPGPTPEEPGSRPSKKDSKPVKKEKKENSPAHVKTDNTTPRSKLDDVPLHRPLPQIGGTSSPSPTGHPDPDKRNITKLPPMEMTSESEEKKKKKKKKKKQSDGLANDGYDD